MADKLKSTKLKSAKLKSLDEELGLKETSSSSYATNQANYLKDKLIANGIDPNNATDTRNFLEKSLNLTPDQNVLFDILELINRPQQALFGAIDSAQKGKDAWKGALEGLSGNKDTSGGQLLRNAGFEDSKGIGADDILGFGLDVLLDPMDLIGVGLAGKAGKAVGTVGDIAKTADTIGDIAKVADTVDDASKALKVGVKIPFTKIGQDLTTPSDAVFKALGKGAKGSIKLADEALEGALGVINDNALDTYKGVKTELTDIFNSGSRLARDQIRKLSNSVRGRAGVGSEKALKDIGLYVGDLKDRVAKSPQLSNDLANLGYDMTKEKGISEFLNDLYKSEEIESFREIFKDGMNLEDLFKVTGDLAINEGGSIYLPDGKMTRGVLDRIEKVLDQNLKGKSIVESLGFTNKYPILSETYKNGFDKLWSKSNGVIKFNKELTNELLDFAKDVNYGNEIGKINGKLWEKTGFFGKSALSPTLSTGKGTINDLVNALNKTADGQDILENYSHFSRKILGDIDKVIAEGGFNTKGSWQANEAYSQNLINENILDLTKNNSSFRKLLGERSLSDKIPSSYFDSFAKKILGTNDADFLPNLDKGVRDMVTQTILEEGFYDKGENFISNLKKLADNDGAYAKKLSDTVIFNSYIKDIVGNDLVNETKKTIDMLSSPNFSWKTVNDTIRNSTSSIHFLPTGAIDNMDRSLLNSLQEVNVSELKRAINNIPTRTQKSFSKTSLGKSLNKVLSEAEGNGSFWIDKQVNSYIKLVSNPKQTTSKVISLVNDLNNGFKKGKLLSPGFNIRNIIGNAFNMLMAGVPVNEVVTGVINGVKEVQLADEALKLLREGAEITPEMKKAVDDINQLRYLGFSEAGTIVQGVEDLANHSKTGALSHLGKVGNAIDSGVTKINDLNINLNNKVDTASRLALFNYARNNPEWLTKNGFKDFGEAVAFSLFDPDDLSLAEKYKIKKVIPFYTFAKKNLMYQIQNLPKNGSKYYEFKKAIDGLWNMTGLDEEEISPYRSDSFQIPIPIAKKDGTFNVLDASLPINDLLDFIENPANKIASSMSPLIRAPFELSNNLNTYSGVPIENFPGEKSDLLSRTPLANTPINRKTTEWGLGLFGLDTPIKTTANVWDLLTNNTFQGGDLVQNTIDNLSNLTGVIKQNDPAKAKISRDYQTLEKLENYIDLLKQNGIELQTLSEIENSKKSNLKGLEASLSKLLNK